jgi:hypothetical protein
VRCSEEKNGPLVTDRPAQQEPERSGPRPWSRVDAARVGQSVEFAFDDVECLSTGRDVRGDTRPDDRFKRCVDLASAGPGVLLVLAERTPRKWWVEIVRRHDRSVPGGADVPGLAGCRVSKQRSRAREVRVFGASPEWRAGFR